MSTLDEKNKSKRIKEKETTVDHLKDAGVFPKIEFETVGDCIWSIKGKRRKKEKEKIIFDDTIEPNVIKIRKMKVWPGLSNFKERYDFGKITGYYLETLFCIILRERKFTREQVSELFGIKLSEATQILKGKVNGWNSSFPYTLAERFEKLGYTLAEEI